MRKLIPFIMKLSVALIVLSVIGQQVSATKGDVERALELLKQARAAIGGEPAINSIQNLSITGKSRKTLQLPDQVEKELNGEFEMHMLLPDRLIKMEKLMMGMPGEGRAPAAIEEKDVKISLPRVRIVRGAEGAEIHNAMRQHEHSEIARYMLGLLLTPPSSFNATYNYVGDGEVSGARADIIEAQGANGFALKIFLDKTSHLPLMMSYQGKMPLILMDKVIRADGPPMIEDDADEIIQEGSEGKDSPRIFIRRKTDDPSASPDGGKFTLPVPAPVNAEIQVRFTDFRNVNGVLLPHMLTQFVNGKVDSVWTVDRYEINSPNINEKFQKDMHFRVKHN